MPDKNTYIVFSLKLRIEVRISFFEIVVVEILHLILGEMYEKNHESKNILILCYTCAESEAHVEGRWPCRDAVRLAEMFQQLDEEDAVHASHGDDSADTKGGRHHHPSVSAVRGLCHGFGDRIISRSSTRRRTF